MVWIFDIRLLDKFDIWRTDRRANDDTLSKLQMTVIGRNVKIASKVMLRVSVALVTSIELLERVNL